MDRHDQAAADMTAGHISYCICFVPISSILLVLEHDADNHVVTKTFPITLKGGWSMQFILTQTRMNQLSSSDM